MHVIIVRSCIGFFEILSLFDVSSICSLNAFEAYPLKATCSNSIENRFNKISEILFKMNIKLWTINFSFDQAA